MHIQDRIHRSFIFTFNATTLSGFIRALNATINKGFNREQCSSTVQQLLNNIPSLANDTSFFWQNSSGHIFSDPDNPILLESACSITCGGSGMGWYPDTATRLLTWFIPAIILISSINFAPIGINKFLAISHMFGDPIHSLWSLLSKLEDWDHCYEMARSLLHPDTPRPSNGRGLKAKLKIAWQFIRPLHAISIDPEARDIAVILAAIRELQQPDNYDNDVKYIYVCPGRCFGKMYKEVAANIVDKRMTGTKIAPPMLLSWLLPVILLNNIVGQCRVEDYIRIIRQFEKDIEASSKAPQGSHLVNCDPSSTPSQQVWTAKPEDLDWKDFLNSQAWSGGIYSCQFNKPMFESGKRRFRPWLLVAVAVTSVCISFTMAFAVLYSYPTYFSCRSIMIIGMTFVWLASPFMTRAIMNNSIFGAEKKTRWKILFFKDYLIGFSIIFLLVASSCGLGNSCRCWSGFLNKVGGVALSPEKQFTKNNAYIYPILIAMCLFAQYLVFKIALYLGKTGLGIMTWSDRDRQDSLPRRAATSAPIQDPLAADAAAAAPQLQTALVLPVSESEEEDFVTGESGYPLLV